MGLDDFKTEGPRTWTPEEQKNNKQETLEGGRKPFYYADFVKEWGIEPTEAERDPEFVAERVKDGYTYKDLVGLFHSLGYVTIDTIVEAVDEGHLELNDLEDEPKEYHNVRRYNGRTLQEVVKAKLGHTTLDSIDSPPSTTTAASSTASSESKSDNRESSGLDSFIS